VGGTTIYCGRSMGGKIITRLNFVMQSIYFLYFRSRHDILSKIKAQKRMDWSLTNLKKLVAKIEARNSSKRACNIIL